MVTEQDFINYIMERLNQADEEMEKLRILNQFKFTTAQAVTKRTVEDIGSYVIKNIIRAGKSSNTSCGVKEC